MALLACITEVLERERMPYVAFKHPPAYTALEQAAVSHIRGRCAAKVVICIADDKPLQAVVPAHYRVDLERLRQIAGAGTLRLATEERDRGALSRVRGRGRPAIWHAVRPSSLRGAVLRGRTGDGVRRGHAHRVAVHALL